jgi:pilus assembly protein CpaB
MVGAIGLALLAAVFAFAALRTIGGGGGSGVSDGPLVVVAAQRIEAGQVIDDGMLNVVRVSDSADIEGALTERSAVVGLKARHPIEKGGQFTTGMLAREDECTGNPLSCIVPAGRRGVTVEVSEEKLFGGLLAPGDHVDVIAIVERTIDGKETQTAVALVQNAEVVAVADESLEPIARLDSEGNPIATDEATDVLGAQPDDLESQPDARSVTLAVLPEEALRVALAQEQGSVWLSLRGSGDEETPPIEDQTLN